MSLEAQLFDDDFIKTNTVDLKKEIFLWTKNVFKIIFIQKFLFENDLDEGSEFEQTKIINKRFILRVKEKLDKKRIFKNRILHSGFYLLSANTYYTIFKHVH